MNHNHHIIPKHLGGTDSKENLVEVAVEKHAELHKQLWEDLGHWEDYLAWQGLSKMKSTEECIKLAISEGGHRFGPEIGSTGIIKAMRDTR